VRIVVTGTLGQLARSLAERAPHNDATLVAVGRPALELTRPETVRSALRDSGAEIIVNAAAWVAVDEGEAAPERLFAVNAVGAGAVAETALSMNLPVVQISTDYVFSGHLGRAYVETDTLDPTNQYGRSKAEGEELVVAANPRHVILRTATLYSCYGTSFVRTMLRLAQTRDILDVVTDVVASPTSALDLADGIFSVCRRVLADPGDRALLGVFHLTGQGWCSRAELAEVVLQASGRLGGPTVRVRPVRSSHFPAYIPRPPFSPLDCSKIKAVYGIVLPEWRSSVEACVARLVKEAEAV